MPAQPPYVQSGKETAKIDVRLSYKIVRLFSEGLYASPNKALEELVANSFDAGAQRVAVFLPANFHDQAATVNGLHPFSRPHLTFERAPVKPFRRFLAGVDTVVANCPRSGARAIGPATAVKNGDARCLDVESQSIDLVLTSPPYLNGIDYLRCSKFSLVWMGYTIEELRQIRADSVGAEASVQEALDEPWVKALIKQLGLKPALSSRDYGILARYVWDIGRAIAEVSRVLRNGGRAVYVVGDSTTRGTFIRNSTIVEHVAEAKGLSFLSRHSRTLPAKHRYLPPPRGRSGKSLDGRLRREVVIVFEK